jgi:hypothetical protein
VLREGVVLLGGEARFRQLWTTAGATEDVVACWRERCGDRAWVLTREEAEYAGWFGALPTASDPASGRCWWPRAALRGTGLRGFPVETRMRGFHGSLTPAEMYVPCWSTWCRADRGRATGSRRAQAPRPLVTVRELAARTSR